MTEYYKRAEKLINKHKGCIHTPEAQKDIDAICKDLRSNEYGLWLIAFTLAFNTYHADQAYLSRKDRE